MALAHMNVKQASERADLDALLLRLSQLDGLTPDAIEHSIDRSPDFVLTVAGGEIGVEVTQSVYQEYVRGAKLHASDCPNFGVNLTNLVDRPRRRSRAEILRSMLSGRPQWQRVDLGMIAWKTKIGASLLSKRRALNRPSYRIFQKNWLLIHDTPCLPDYREHFDFASRYLVELFTESGTFKRDFDCVFVHSHLFLFRWSQGALDWNYDRPVG